MRVSIESNIGGGKTELIRILKNRFNYYVFEENMAGWQTWLDLVSKAPQRWMFHLHVKILRDMGSIPNPQNRTVIVERSPFSSRFVFAHDAKKQGVLTNDEYVLYLSLYDIMGWKPDFIIFINVPPEVCHSRIKKRGRVGEQSLTLDDLRRLHQRHLTMIQTSGIPYVQLDDDQDGSLLHLAQLAHSALQANSGQPVLPKHTVSLPVE